MNRNMFEPIESLDVFQQSHHVDGILGSIGHSIGEQYDRSNPGNLECRIESTVSLSESVRIIVVDELEGPSFLIWSCSYQLI